MLAFVVCTFFAGVMFALHNDGEPDEDRGFY